MTAVHHDSTRPPWPASERSNPFGSLAVVTQFARQQGRVPKQLFPYETRLPGLTFISTADAKSRRQDQAAEADGALDATTPIHRGAERSVFENIVHEPAATARGVYPTFAHDASAEISADVSNSSQNNNDTSILRRRNKKLHTKPLNLSIDISPSDRAIPIGIAFSPPSATALPRDSSLARKDPRGSHLSHPTPIRATALHVRDLPTPSIVVTPAAEDFDATSAIPFDYRARARPTSSVYSRYTTGARRSQFSNNQPPVPPLPPTDGSHDYDARMSRGTAFEDEAQTPQSVYQSILSHRFWDRGLSRADSQASRPPTAALATPRRSRGWWNVITSPFSARSSGAIFWRSPPLGSDGDEKKPIIDNIAPISGSNQVHAGVIFIDREADDEELRSAPLLNNWKLAAESNLQRPGSAPGAVDINNPMINLYRIPEEGEAASYYNPYIDFATPKIGSSAGIESPCEELRGWSPSQSVALSPRRMRAILDPVAPDDGIRTLEDDSAAAETTDAVEDAENSTGRDESREIESNPPHPAGSHAPETDWGSRGLPGAEPVFSTPSLDELEDHAPTTPPPTQGVKGFPTESLVMSPDSYNPVVENAHIGKFFPPQAIDEIEDVGAHPAAVPETNRAVEPPPVPPFPLFDSMPDGPAGNAPRGQSRPPFPDLDVMPDGPAESSQRSEMPPPLPPPPVFDFPHDAAFGSTARNAETPPVPPFPVFDTMPGAPSLRSRQNSREYSNSDAIFAPHSSDWPFSETKQIQAIESEQTGAHGSDGSGEVKPWYQRFMWWIIVSVILTLVLVVVLLVIYVPRNHPDAPVQIQWLNLTGFPAMVTGVATVIQPPNVASNDACVAPRSVWTCAAPDHSQGTLPNFRLEIGFQNGIVPSNETGRLTKRASWSDSLFSSSPAPPSQADQIFLGQTTDNNSTPCNGEATPFFLSLLDPLPLPVPASSKLRRRDTTFRYPYPEPSSEQSTEATSSENLSTAATPTANTGSPSSSTPSQPLTSNLSTSPSQPIIFPTPTPAASTQTFDTGQAPTNAPTAIPPPPTTSNNLPQPQTLYPLVIAQPLRLYNRGQSTEHYGFYTYFDRTVYTTTTTSNSSSPQSNTTTAVCTFAQTRLRVQIWTRRGSLSNTAFPPSNPSTSHLPAAAPAYSSSANSLNTSSFPFPVTIMLDRHGGSANRKSVYCYTLDAAHHVIDDSGSWIAEDRAEGGQGLVHPAEIPGAASSSTSTTSVAASAPGSAATDLASPQSTTEVYPYPLTTASPQTSLPASSAAAASSLSASLSTGTDSPSSSSSSAPAAPSTQLSKRSLPSSSATDPQPAQGIDGGVGGCSCVWSNTN